MSKTNPVPQNSPTSLFPKDYWDRPLLDPSDRGDPSGEPIYCAVGYALSMWETAENALADMFLIMSDCNTLGAYMGTRRAFGSIETSAGRRRMLTAVAEVYFGSYWADPLIKRPFKQLKTAFEDASERRDDIAHGIATSISINNNDMGTFLLPAEYNTGRNTLFPEIKPDDPLSNTMRGRYRYTAATIIGFANKFGELRNKTVAYIGQMRKIGGVPMQVLVARGIDPAQYEASLAKQ